MLKLHSPREIKVRFILSESVAVTQATELIDV